MERTDENQMISIEPLIRIIRNQQVILDSELALLYGVETKRLNEQVKRNIDRFPDDFMFQLSKEEAEESRSQFATLNKRGHNIKHLPYAFTENGIAMLSSVLRSPVAIQTNIRIMRAFTVGADRCVCPDNSNKSSTRMYSGRRTLPLQATALTTA